MIPEDAHCHYQRGSMHYCVFGDYEEGQPIGTGYNPTDALADLLEQVKCETCDGDGRVLDHNKFTLDKGKWMRSFDEIISVDCPDCDGKGRLHA